MKKAVGALKKNVHGFRKKKLMRFEVELKVFEKRTNVLEKGLVGWREG